MSRKNRNKHILLKNIKIIDTAHKGKSITKHEERVIIVEGGVPGDICDITVFKRKKKYWQAKIEKIHKYSEIRTQPKCKHFGTCGGCKWQNINYQAQLYFKQKEVLNNLKRIGNIQLSNHQKILGSKNTYFYRNKMEFTFSNKRWLTKDEINSNKEINNRNACGLHVPGMFDKVINLQECYLQKEPSNSIRLSVNNFASKHDLSYFDIKKHKGLLRNLIIKISTNNEIMVLIQFYEKNMKKISLLMNHLKNTFPEITSLLYTINKKANNTIYDQEIICYHGEEYINENIDNLTFRIGPKSFFQTNSIQTNILYKKVKELAKINKQDIVYDLYTGTGTIAQYVSVDAKKVVGIDSVEEGIKAAYINAKDNKITNCKFYTGDMKELFTDKFIDNNEKPNIIITDPPRDGMHKNVIKQILNINPERIVYVSCNSATQARDIALMKHIYKLTHVQPVDMFPQTHHVENIVVLERR